MREQTPHKSLDCTGLLCPMPVMKTNQAIRELPVGQILELIASDPGAMADIEAWASRTQHELLMASKLDDGKVRLLIRKTH